MRSILFISLLWLLSLAAHAQDTVTTIDGSAFPAKITQIGVNEIRYKKWSDPDGPVYVQEKSGLHSIRLSSGIVEEFNPLRSQPGSAAAYDTIIRKDGSRVAAKITELNAAEIKYKAANNPDGPVYVEPKASVSAIHYAGGLVETLDDGTAANPPGPITLSSAPLRTDNYNTSGSNNTSSNDYYGGSSPNYERYYIKQTHGYYLYNGKHLKEREMQDVLMNTKDKELIGLVQSSRDAHALKFIGFGAIPLGIASVLVLASGLNYNGTISGGKATTAGLLFAGAIACPVISIVYGHKRNAYNRQAIRIYNERY